MIEMIAIDRRIARAELEAILKAYDARDEQEFRAACHRWHQIRFPEPEPNWIPKDDDFVRFKSGHPREGKIERVSIITLGSMSTAWVRLVDVIDLVDPALLEPWRPWTGDWVTFRGGHALAGYSYPVNWVQITTRLQEGGSEYTSPLLKLEGLTYPIELSKVMPATGRIVVGPGCTLTPRT